jgi:hypothetical protein
VLADAVGPEHRADPADMAGGGQAGQAVDHLVLGKAQAGGQQGVGARGQWEIALEFIEQAAVDGVHSAPHTPPHRPMRPARLVKKMPLGLSAGRVVRRAKLAVS